MLDGID